MIVPKIHTAKLSEIGDEASVEFIRLVETYEMNGYSLYARAVNSKLRSVVHQHTHLIKLDGRQRNFLFMLRKPWYFRLSK
jgi:diadenosine tetraphosphate (Ap4A) HIT family hydrolase